MPLPTPNSDESQDEFIERCMANETMKDEYAQDQRLAVCFSQWRRRDDPPLARGLAFSRIDPGEPYAETRSGGEIRLETIGLARVIRGHPIVFGRLSHDLGGFREQIAPEAIQRTLDERIDLRALVDHDPSKILGRLGAGTLRVARDAHGLAIELDVPNTTDGQNIAVSLARGDVTGGSFGFQVVNESESWWDFKATPPIRTVWDMRVREVSIVTWPAYPQTAVAVRSMTRFGAGGRMSVSARLAEAQRRKW